MKEEENSEMKERRKVMHLFFHVTLATVNINILTKPNNMLLGGSFRPCYHASTPLFVFMNIFMS